jgi:hypothetical protein
MAALAKEQGPLKSALVLVAVMNLHTVRDAERRDAGVCGVFHRLRTCVRFEERHGRAYAGGMRAIAMLNKFIS